jgi:allophanate hydrolase
MNASDIPSLLDRLDARGVDPVWIARLARAQVMARARGAPDGPLRGATFAIKDNIDLGGVPTTAGCPAFAYTPAGSSPVVQRLIEAGAVPVGKANLDQFATGLVGVRSPYGVPVNPFGADYIPGGSSSGSAVAVAAALCDFALGTDTAGSGRVPAAFNNLVGVKPTRGLLSTRGVVPACRSLDCVSIFARTVADGALVLRVAAGYDPGDPFSRPGAPPLPDPPWPPRIGMPRAGQLEFFGDAAAERLFAAAIARWRSLGAHILEVDYAPFLEAAELLYGGPWVAERFAAIRGLIEREPDALHPITRQIIEGARRLTAVDAFDAMYALAALRRRADAVWSDVDALVTPTAGTIYTLAEVAANPIGLNTRLGRYTNHVNLLDLCALAIPAGFLPSGLPWGITLSAPAFCDDRLLRLGAMFLGEGPPPHALSAAGPLTKLVVCGAHMTGQPLNGELTRLGATLLQVTRTAPRYRLFALPGTTPPRPGLMPASQGGASVEVEVWELPLDGYGHFAAALPAPLAAGAIEVEDGGELPGVICAAANLDGARDITSYGGWRAFLRAGR